MVSLRLHARRLQISILVRIVLLIVAPVLFLFSIPLHTGMIDLLAGRESQRSLLYLDVAKCWDVDTFFS
jgi:hypothetical protein